MCIDGLHVSPICALVWKMSSLNPPEIIKKNDMENVT